MRWSGGRGSSSTESLMVPAPPLKSLTHTGKRFLHLTLVLLHRIGGFPEFLFLL